MGEHAVVYGRPALVAATGLRLRARATELPRSDARVELILPAVGHREVTSWRDVAAHASEARRRWEAWAADPSAAGFDLARGRDPAHGVKVALGEAARFLGDVAGRQGPPGGPALRLEVESDIPVGSGLGSSAALAVAVLSAYLTLRGASAGAERLEALAREVERRQHGFPSGVDAATVIHGGAVWAVPDGDRLRTEPLGDHVAARLSRFRAFDTGAPAQSTGAVVGEVRARLRADPRLEEVVEEMGRTTRRFRTLLEEGPEGCGERPDAAAGTELERGCVEAVRAFERGLEALGVVPERVRRLVRAVEEGGGAAKVSGAGALRSPAEGPPGAGCLLVHPPPGGDVSAGRGPLAGLDPLDCRLGAPGCRREVEWREGAGAEA